MREALFWLRLLRDVTACDENELEELLDESNQLVAILTTIVRRARENEEKSAG